ncbi:DUF3305 domain-containing protein [Sulfitobacter sp. CW3]|uniref:DUF3305 domain-containing protein n=1 Tax=Sulfitobacter sp. CW3 TaxID=2861965 RepID=UPI0021507B06|nr:DUF3305 domain-containing protein [Sulfitobacter sp. CW3]
MPRSHPNSVTIPVGVVVRRTPGATRWAKYAWTVTDILPGAAPADWKVLRTEGDVTEYHAATLPLTLYVPDAEAYAHELQARVPSIYTVLRPNAQSGGLPWSVALVTASPYEAQDYCDSAEELVEKLPMPHGLRAWVIEFVEKYYEEEAFVKRRRKNARVDQTDDGVGDSRIRQTTDVYRAPRRREVIN